MINAYRERDDGTEYWSARELAPALEYSKWENFYKVIKKAMISCENSGRSILDQIPEVRNLVEGGVAPRSKIDYELTRYACVRRDLRRLTDEGMIEHVGSNRFGHYVIK